MLSTQPTRTGSGVPPIMTIGSVRVAARAAPAAPGPTATRSLIDSARSSAASTDSRSSWPPV